MPTHRLCFSYALLLFSLHLLVQRINAFEERETNYDFPEAHLLLSP